MSGPTGKKNPPVPRKKGGKPAKSARPGSRLTILILAALLIGISLQIYRMFGQLQMARTEETVYAQQLEELRETNRQLREDLDNSGSQALIEDIARDKLGMVMPGEKVIHISK